ncbi:MAG: hypothetical protein V1884_01880 [Candidatus Omnitrophota bacterium]
MKKLKTILYALIISFVLLSGINVFAVETSPITGVSEKTTIHVEYLYNAYGMAVSSADTTTTITTTTNEKGETSTTTTTYTTTSVWRGGSLKVASTTGTSKNESANGANSTTEFQTNYEYNDKGQLKAASGESQTTGDRGKNDAGEELGTYESTSEDTYIVQNGQSLKKTSVATGINYGPEGQKESDSTETTTYDYELKGGSWALVKQVDKSETKNVDGGTSLVEKTKTYTRDANGVCTGITQAASGTLTAVGGNGGTQTYTMQNYKAEFKFDAEMGWYLSKESYDWE